jgi:hypothetical protein
MIDGHTAPKPNVVYNLITTHSPATSTTQSTSERREEREAKSSFNSGASVSSFDAAPHMSEKKRAASSWKDKEKKESKLSRFMTGKTILVFQSQHSDLIRFSAIKKNEPSEPSKKNWTSAPGWAGWLLDILSLNSIGVDYDLDSRTSSMMRETFTTDGGEKYTQWGLR